QPSQRTNTRQHLHPGYEMNTKPAITMRKGSQGFTIIELVVVSAIIITMMGAGFAVLSRVRTSTNLDIGVNSISSAVAAARVYITTAPKADLDMEVAGAK